MVERYLVPAYGTDESALGVALQALAILGKKHNSEVAIVVPALKHAAGTILKRLIPEQQVKRLAKGEILTIGEDEIPLSMVSPLTLRNTRAQIFLGLFASKKMIQKIEAQSSSKAIVIMPWAGEEDIDEWKAKWSPTVLTIPKAT